MLFKSLFAAYLGLIAPTLAGAPAAATTAAKATTEASQPASVDQVVKNVQAYYNGIKKLSANFRQEYTNTTFGRTSTSDGNLYVMKPGQMRWDYTKPDKKHFISDGKVLWVYIEDAKQAYKVNLSQQLLPVAITFLYGKGDLATEFTSEFDNSTKYAVDKGDYVLKLTPKTPTTAYKNLWLVVDASDYHVKRSVILEASDNINQITFTKVHINDKTKGISAKSFKFDPKSVGAKVVQPPSDQQTQSGAAAGSDAK